LDRLGGEGARMSVDPHDSPPLVIPTGRRKRRGGFQPVYVLWIVLLLSLGLGGAYLKFGNHIVPVTALPDGRPSVSEAQACLREGDVICAEADYAAYLKKYPNDARANGTLAIVLTQDGRHREALPYYRKAFEGAEPTYDLYANYAVSLEATGDLDGAIKANYSALEIVPSLVDVRGSLAKQLVKKGRKQEAINLLDTFDRSLEDRGEAPYFERQVAEIKKSATPGVAVATGAPSDHLAPDDKAAPGKGVTLVPLTPGTGVLYVPVTLNGTVDAHFVVDSGATHVVLSQDVVRELVRKGKLTRGDYLGSGQAILADGSRISSEILNLRSLKVGDRELHNITAVVSPGRGQLLLGQSFLRRFKSWSIDNHKRMLVLTD
jgi:clan AA aspartic protease (TIGR02281 family)